MDPAGLLSLPAEVLLYLFLFLTEEDLLSLCHSCVHLYCIMDDDKVWKRFITDKVRSLEHQPQQVSPDNPLPDLPLCANRKHLMRKRRLLSNWRNQRCVTKITTDLSDIVKKLVIYKDSYVLRLLEKSVELWDISSAPVLLTSMAWPGRLLPKNSSYIVADRLVLVSPPRVCVFQVNIQDNSISHLYSFVPGENRVINEFVPGNDEDSSWRFCKAGNNFACVECFFDDYHIFHPVIHLWDIVQGCQVGKIIAPLEVLWISQPEFHENELVLKAITPHEDRLKFFKYSVDTGQFSISTATAEPACLFFYHKNHILTCTYNRGVQGDSATYSVFDYDLSVKLMENTFATTHQGKYNVFSDGKLIIVSDSQLFVVEPLSLEILCVVPRKTTRDCRVRLMSVFGVDYLEVKESTEKLKLWSIGSRTPTLVKLMVDKEEMSSSKIISVASKPFAKIVYYFSVLEQGNKMTVCHYW